MIQKLGDLVPDVANAAFIAPNATVIGNVVLGENVTVWYGVLIRGDIEPIRIGDRTNIQDNSVLHVAHGFPLNIGSDVTIGHGALVHACTVGANSLIGMGAIVLDGANIPSNCMVGAGALVPPGKSYPEGSLLVGAPARAVRALREEELATMKNRIREYVANGKRFSSDATEVL